MLATTKALTVINQLRDEGLIPKYALAGEMAAIFYIPPSQTQEIDVLINLETVSGTSPRLLAPITIRLEELGHSTWKNDKLVIEDWEIHFLPAAKPVAFEAIEYATSKLLTDGVSVPVPPPEYLMLLDIDSRTPHEVMRLYHFEASKAYDQTKLWALLERHHLVTTWQKILTLFRIQEKTLGVTPGEIGNFRLLGHEHGIPS